MSTSSIEGLELKAVEQRGRLHRAVVELGEKIYCTREKLRFSREVPQHLAAISILAGLVGLVSGYGFARLFTRR